MTPDQIRTFLENYETKRTTTIAIVDFANVDKWNSGKVALGWDVGIPQLATFIKRLSYGSQELRRFYYGSDYGRNEKSTILLPWSAQMHQHAQYNKFDIQTKRVKYIFDSTNETGFDKKCDLDVEMSVDLIKMQEKYKQVVIFSGDGDLVYALQYLHDAFQKQEFYVFASRGHIGREVIDAERSGLITQIFYAEDFESRLSRTYRGGGGTLPFFGRS